MSTRRNFLKALGLGAASLALPGCGALFHGRTAKNKRPNVLIFYTDDQGTLDVNCYGSKDLHTPNMDSLARTGVRFTQAYAHTVCCPSRALLLTGRHPPAIQRQYLGPGRRQRQRTQQYVP